MKNDENKEIKEIKKNTKTIYHFDCLNYMGNDNNVDSSEFKSEREAIQLAMDYEADLYRITLDEEGNKIDSKCIYESWSCFG